MDYGPNDDAATYLIDEILPLLRRSVADLEVLIVGRDPTPALAARARQHHHVTVTGFVDDVRPYLERASLFVAPVRYASGTQNKVLEALSMGLPVVTTPCVAAGLLIDGAGRPPVHVASGKIVFAERIIGLLDNEPERARLAAEGRRFVQDHFIWSRSAEKLENMCCRATAVHRPRQQTAGARTNHVVA